LLLQNHDDYLQLFPLHLLAGIFLLKHTKVKFYLIYYMVIQGEQLILAMPNCFDFLTILKILSRIIIQSSGDKLSQYYFECRYLHLLMYLQLYLLRASVFLSLANIAFFKLAMSYSHNPNSLCHLAC
jgi:hypothetical protein